MMREGTVEANGLAFTYFEEGDGPLVLLLHGFPDNAATWDRVMPSLVDAGYRTVAPFMRGYPPTAIPSDARYDAAALADDVAGLIDALGDGEQAFVVGHDWGAMATYSAVALHPDKIRRAVAIAIGHPGGLVRIFEHPDILHYAFHVWLFQVPGLSEQAVRHDDFAMIDYLWNLWSPSLEDPEHIKGVKETLAAPGAVEAALGYYRATLQFQLTHPELAQKIQFTPATVPTLQVFGDGDRGFRSSDSDDQFLAAEHRLETVEGAGHFVQRQQPEALSRLILEWLGA